MKMDWLRLYSEARNDAKLRALTDRQHRIWFNLLCFANEQPERGRIIAPDRELLALEVADGDCAALDDTLARLVRLRIVEASPEAVCFLNWLKRQYDKPSDTPPAVKARVQAHRATVAPVTPPPPPSGVTSDDVTPCNADETPGNAYTQIREEESREETIIPPTPQPTEAPPVAAADAARGKAVKALKVQPVPKPGAGFDFPALWALVEADQGHKLTWAWDRETKAVKTLLTAYPSAQPADFARFLAYVGTCWPFCDEPTRQPTFSAGAPHFSAWYTQGQPAACQPPVKERTDGHRTTAAQRQYSALSEWATAAATGYLPDGEPHQNLRLIRPEPTQHAG